MSSQAQEHVLRVRRSDHDGEYVLVNVSSNGSKPLDLKIRATEGENPYAASTKQSRVSKQPIRDPKNSLSENEWEAILRSHLLQHFPNDTVRTLGSGGIDRTEVVATVAQQTSLTLHFRNNIGGIIQRLGQIDLKHDPDLEIDTISWAHIAVSRADTLSAEIQSLQAKYSAHNDTIEKLNKQLADLIAAKKEHEDALMHKFRDLLNSKKLKIRDQQRLLVSAKIDPGQVANVKAARSGVATRNPGKSRKGKRKVDIKEEEEEDDEEREGFAAMPQVKKDVDSEEEEARHTPEHTDDDVTADEDDSSGEAQGVESKTLPDRTDSAVHGEHMQVNVPPPVRQLPFEQKAASSATTESTRVPSTQQKDDAPIAANHDDDEDETDDDEL